MLTDALAAGCTPGPTLTLCCQEARVLEHCNHDGLETWRWRVSLFRRQLDRRTLTREREYVNIAFTCVHYALLTAQLTVHHKDA